jgi:hypothetical protein
MQSSRAGLYLVESPSARPAGTLPFPGWSSKASDSPAHLHFAVSPGLPFLTVPKPTATWFNFLKLPRSAQLLEGHILICARRIRHKSPHCFARCAKWV